MRKTITDIDIDFANRDKALALFKHIPAMMIRNNKKVRHNVGVYFQDIPNDPYNGFANIDYKEAEERGYFKVDFLNIGIYNEVRDNEHLEELLNTEPVWELLQYEEIVTELFQLSNSYHIVKKMLPSNVTQLAMVLALIRPAKKYLIGKSWEEIEKEIWMPSNDGYHFKKSHAISYAMVVTVQLNLIAEKAMSTDNDIISFG